TAKGLLPYPVTVSGAVPLAEARGSTHHVLVCFGGAEMRNVKCATKFSVCAFSFNAQCVMRNAKEDSFPSALLCFVLVHGQGRKCGMQEMRDCFFPSAFFVFIASCLYRLHC